MPVFPAVRATVLLAVTAASLTILVGCGSGSSGGDGGTSGSHETITLYSGQHQQTTDKLVAGFEKATGINVKTRFGDEDVLDDQIQTEGSHSPADVFFTENTMPLQDLANHGLLASIDPTTLAHTPSKYNSPQGKWVGVSARVSVLDYNPSLISKSQLPTTALELADPTYNGKLAIAPGESDFQPVVTSMLRAYGKARTLQWLKGLKANAGDTHTFPDNETIADEVNRGQVAFGLVNQYYWYRLDAEVGASNDHSQITPLANGDPGYVLGVAGAGVLASSGHKAAAQKFVAYLTGKAGQEDISHSNSFEYPIASGVRTSQPETPLDQLHPNSITLPQLGDAQSAIAVLHEAQLL
jgi:iron(III) transport system substrate-binding protein